MLTSWFSSKDSCPIPSKVLWRSSSVNSLARIMSKWPRIVYHSALSYIMNPSHIAYYCYYLDVVSAWQAQECRLEDTFFDWVHRQAVLKDYPAILWWARWRDRNLKPRKIKSTAGMIRGYGPWWETLSLETLVSLRMRDESAWATSLLLRMEAKKSSFVASAGWERRPAGP